jgi:hypothetical protein
LPALPLTAHAGPGPARLRRSLSLDAGLDAALRQEGLEAVLERIAMAGPHAGCGYCAALGGGDGGDADVDAGRAGQSVGPERRAAGGASGGGRTRAVGAGPARAAAALGSDHSGGGGSAFGGQGGPDVGAELGRAGDRGRRRVGATRPGSGGLLAAQG